MIEPSSPRRVYSAHRDKQRRRILDAAEKLFDERGIDRVTMADIISATELSASTIYQYFPDKSEIVWAIVGEFLAETVAGAEKTILEVRGPALAKISALLDILAGDLAKNPARVRFMAQFDAMYARDWPVDRLLKLEGQVSPSLFASFTELIGEGIADGSLRPDLDPNLTMHAVMNAIIGTQRRLASLGDRVEIEYGRPIEQLFRETIRIILFGLRAN